MSVEDILSLWYKGGATFTRDEKNPELWYNNPTPGSSANLVTVEVKGSDGCYACVLIVGWSPAVTGMGATQAEAVFHAVMNRSYAMGASDAKRGRA
jgi:hypothetical protein